MTSHVEKIASFLPGADLQRLRTLTSADVSLLVRCISAGVPPRAFPETLRAYKPGEEYDVAPSSGVTPARKILAYSFLRDPQQYAATYAQSHEWAGRFRGILDSEPEKALAEIAAVVNRKLKEKGSPAVADVVVGQVRGSTGSSATGGASDPNYPPLQAAMVKYSAQAGAYSFEAEDRGSPPNRRFVVVLGRKLVVGAQRKATAVMAARLVRVLGRHEQVLQPYVGTVDDDDDFDWDDIPDDVPDGRPPRRPSPQPRKSSQDEGSTKTADKGKEEKPETSKPSAGDK